MLRNKSTFKTKLRDELFRRETLDHPVFDLLAESGPNLPLLWAVALQGYALVLHFPHYVAALLALCPRGMGRHHARLAENCYEEFTGGISRTQGHVELLDRFLTALGISPEESARAEPLPGTSRLIHYRWELIESGPARYHEAVAAVMIASEGQNIQKKARQMRQGVLEKVYGLSSEALTFFRVHYQEDPRHVADGLDLVADLCTNEAMQDEAIRAVRETCDLYWTMHTHILDAFAAPTIR